MTVIVSKQAVTLSHVAPPLGGNIVTGARAVIRGISVSRWLINSLKCTISHSHGNRSLRPCLNTSLVTV